MSDQQAMLPIAKKATMPDRRCKIRPKNKKNAMIFPEHIIAKCSDFSLNTRQN